MKNKMEGNLWKNRILLQLRGSIGGKSAKGIVEYDYYIRRVFFSLYWELHEYGVLTELKFLLETLAYYRKKNTNKNIKFLKLSI